MRYFTLAVGLVAVVFYLLGYLQKDRKRIILLNVTSRLLYVFQYVLLGAFEGAVLDIAGTLSSLLAQKKDTPFIRKYKLMCILLANACIVAMGLLTYKNILSLLPSAGVLLHTGAFWLDDEKNIRRLSLLGSPFWLVYNFISGAYGSCVGDLLSMTSILIAMIRYDFKKSK